MSQIVQFPGFEIEVETHVEKRHYLSLTHIESAKRFYRWAKHIEDTGAMPKLPDHMTFTVYGVIASAAFIESTINEFFSDVATGSFVRHASLKNVLSEEVRKKLKAEWEENGAERSNVLKKYQLALKLCNREMFNGNQIYQTAALVLEVRNFLLHYKPDSQIFVSDPKKMKKVENNSTLELCDKLRGKYKENPLLSEPRAADFPGILMSAGCVEWTIKSSVELIAEFFTKLGAAEFAAGISKHCKS